MKVNGFSSRVLLSFCEGTMKQISERDRLVRRSLRGVVESMLVHYTQSELAARLDVSQSTIASYLAERSHPPLPLLEKFADYLGLPVPIFIAQLYELELDGGSMVSADLEAQIRELPLRRRLELLSVLARGIQAEAEDMLRDCGG